MASLVMVQLTAHTGYESSSNTVSVQHLKLYTGQSVVSTRIVFPPGSLTLYSLVT
jgi:hypothetical protein